MKSSYLGHGKVILIGEHAVVYGYNALAMPIKSLQIKATVEPAKTMWMDTTGYQGPLFQSPAEYDGLKYVVKTMLAKAESQAAVKLTYTGEIPIERGLGSSATVALATVRAMNEYFKTALTEKEVMAITNHAEMINHGKASGLDAATVNSDYLVFFNRKDGPQTLKTILGATLLIMDTGELGNTKQAVNMVHEEVQNSTAKAANIQRLGQLADDTKQAWLNQDQAEVGHIFNEAQTNLASLNLSTPKIDLIQKMVLVEKGVLGFKLSGSGLGGIVIVLCRDQTVAQKIAAKCRQQVASSWIEEI